MRILLVNPPHQSIGSRIPREMLPPLGLLSIGGPLIDDGHDVGLIDGDVDNLRLEEIARRIRAHQPDVLMIGHTGSTSAQPTINRLLRMVRTSLPQATFVLGGIFPTYHWEDVLNDAPEVDVIIRGEGEETVRRLARALLMRQSIEAIEGIAFRNHGQPVATCAAPMIQTLDDYRIAWELIDHRRYSYYGGLRGVVIQFSRGCPHLCTFCGQRGYWTRWRHRDPVRFAKEIARLYRTHGIRLISLADENPTTSPKIWRQFLEALIAENLDDLTIIGTFRASDIVRDEGFLHLYRKAGIRRLLIGMEYTDDQTLDAIKKGSTTKTDQRAIGLLRKAGILSLCSFVTGFENETDADYWRAYRQLLTYDPDQIVTLFVTPHRWTPFFRDAKDRSVIQTDRRRWDYKHQVLANTKMPAWRVFLWVKVIEILVQARPKALRRTYLHPDPTLRHGMRWYARMGRRVWFHEIWNFLVRDRRVLGGPSLAQFWGAPQDQDEEALSRRRPKAQPVVTVSPAREAA